jgi:hypothetical protein
MAPPKPASPVASLGANQYGGAKFAAQIAGNPQQETNLQSILQALPNGGSKAEDVRGLLDVLQATGKRQQPVSPTAQYTADMKDGATSGAMGAGLDVLRTMNPMQIVKRLQDGFDRARLGNRSESVARGMLADPEDAASIISRARLAAPEGRNIREILRLFGGNNSNLRLQSPEHAR